MKKRILSLLAGLAVSAFSVSCGTASSHLPLPPQQLLNPGDPRANGMNSQIDGNWVRTGSVATFPGTASYPGGYSPYPTYPMYPTVPTYPTTPTTGVATGSCALGGTPSVDYRNWTLYIDGASGFIKVTDVSGNNIIIPTQYTHQGKQVSVQVTHPSGYCDSFGKACPATTKVPMIGSFQFNYVQMDANILTLELMSDFMCGGSRNNITVQNQPVVR